MSAMLLFVVPQFEGIYGQLGGTLPLPTRILLSMSKACSKTYWYHRPRGSDRGQVLPAALEADRRRGREVMDSSSSGPQCSGPLFHKTALSRFSGTLAMLLRSGVPILQALEIVKRHRE